VPDPVRAGPPKFLETIVGLWIPSVCREEVLGDLHEKYTGLVQYVCLAISVVPFIMYSRIRRTTDAAVLLMEALLMYAAYLTAAWYTDRVFLFSQWGMLRTVLPVACVLLFLVLTDAYYSVPKTSWKVAGRVSMAVVFAFLLVARTLPGRVNLIGAGASLLLVSTLRILFSFPFGHGRTPWTKE
jgi:hypothetical protein